jgi:hypothetical protein
MFVITECSLTTKSAVTEFHCYAIVVVENSVISWIGYENTTINVFRISQIFTDKFVHFLYYRLLFEMFGCKGIYIDKTIRVVKKKSSRAVFLK